MSLWCQYRPKGLAARRPKGLAARRPKGLASRRPKGLAARRPKGLATRRPKGLAARRPKGLAARRCYSVFRDSASHFIAETFPLSWLYRFARGFSCSLFPVPCSLCTPLCLSVNISPNQNFHATEQLPDFF